MGERLLLAACHGYLLCVFVVCYLFGKIKCLLVVVLSHVRR